MVVRPYTPKNKLPPLVVVDRSTAAAPLPPRTPLAPLAANCAVPGSCPKVDASGLPFLPDSLY